MCFSGLGNTDTDKFYLLSSLSFYLKSTKFESTERRVVTYWEGLQMVRFELALKEV
jgi:hypothetical protein